MSIYLAEFIGTFLLILLGNGAVANVVLARSKAENGGWIVITWGWGLAVMIAVYSVGRISGAHINPAVTFGLASIGDFPWSAVPGYVLAQMAGAACGAAVVYLTYLPHWKLTSDGEVKRACFCTSPAVRSPAANFMTEAVASAVLVFGVLAIAAVSQDFGPENLHAGLKVAFDTWFAPLIVGFLVLSIGLSLGGPTGYAINPARDLGPRIAHALLPIPGKAGSDWRYAWIPVAAPLVGGVAAAQIFHALGY